MKSNKGVTLVALVVTIIVLIILAGISINLILGDNGIITIAKKAKENTELAKIEEETELNELYTQLEADGSNSENLPYDSIAKLTEFKTAIANAIEKAGGIKPDVSAETNVFENNINGIVKEVTKNASATAEDITEGKTAWVNGELITGNGATAGKETLNLVSTTSSTTVGKGTYLVLRTSSKYVSYNDGYRGPEYSSSTLKLNDESINYDGSAKNYYYAGALYVSSIVYYKILNVTEDNSVITTGGSGTLPGTLVFKVG